MLARIIVTAVVPLITMTSSFPPHPKSAPCKAYAKSYRKGGAPDPHEAVFQSLAQFLSSSLRSGSPDFKVLYPGCYRHITPSLFFPHVDYVDCDSKVRDVFEDDEVREWIVTDSRYYNPNNNGPAPPTWTFTMANYNTIPFDHNSYDLLISLSAGVVSEPCCCFLKETTNNNNNNNGRLLVNDSHGDASMAFCNPALALEAVYHNNGEWQQVDDSLNDSSPWFRTKKGNTPITLEQARETVQVGTKSKRSFRLAKEAPFYLFRKIPID